MSSGGCGRDKGDSAGRITARRRGGTDLSVDVDDARQQILAAAEQVTMRYSVDKTTMDGIGKEVGISRPTVYRYFSDRDALSRALIERRSRMLFDRARAVIAGDETFAEQLVEGLIYLVDHGRKDPIMRILVSPEQLEVNTTLAGGAGLAAALTGECGRRSRRPRPNAGRFAMILRWPMSRSGWRWFSSFSSAASTSREPTIRATVTCCDLLSCRPSCRSGSPRPRCSARSVEWTRYRDGLYHNLVDVLPTGCSR